MGSGINQEIETRFAAYNDIPAIVLVANQEGEIIFANKAVEAILGYNSNEVLGTNWYQLTHTGQLDLHKRIEEVKELLYYPDKLGTRHLYESPLLTKDGKLTWTQWTNQIIAGNLLLGVGQDITEKRFLKDVLVKKVEENEFLLKEIHHRVKNNLQIISSLLNLQFKDFEADHIKKAVDKSKARINAMALAHNMMYQSKDLSAIDFGTYLKKLLKYVCDAHGCTESFNKKIEHCKASFNADKTILLGLIITELVSNVLEHAYDDDIDKLLEVSLKQISENEHQLLVRDEGVGISKRPKPEKGSLGLELVSTLCDQMNADLKILNGSGTTVDLRF